jgi:hypothetical protein
MFVDCKPILSNSFIKCASSSSLVRKNTSQARKGHFHQENKKRCEVILPSQAALVEVMEAKAAVEVMEAKAAVVGVAVVAAAAATEKVGKWGRVANAIVWGAAAP